MESSGVFPEAFGRAWSERIGRDWIGDVVADCDLTRLVTLRLDALALGAPGLVEALAGSACGEPADLAQAGATLAAAGHQEPRHCVRAAELARVRLARELAGAGHGSAQVANALAAAVARALEQAIDPESGAVVGAAAPVAAMPGRQPAPPPTASDERSAVVFDEAASVLVAASTEAVPPTIDAYDAREEHWLRELDRRLDRQGSEGLAFALIAAEISDAQLIGAADGAGELERLAGAVERTICAALPACEVIVAPGGRIWLIAPAADDREAAGALRAASAAVARMSDRRGEAVALDAGYALCPSDGQDPGRLRHQAELSLSAARPRG